MGERSDELDAVGGADEGMTEQAAGFAERAGIGGEVPYVEIMAPTPPAYEARTYEVTAETSAPSGGDEDLEDMRAQIEETRAGMSETIDAIQGKLSPANLAQEAKETVKQATVGRAQQAMQGVTDSASQVGGGIVDTIVQNPVPAALAALGLGWLFMSGRKQSQTQSYRSSGYRPAYGYGSSYDYGYQSGRSQTGTGAGQAANQAQNAVGQAVSQAQNTAQQTVSQVQDTAQQTVNQVQDTAQQAINQAQDTASQVADQVQATAGQVADQAQYQVQRATSGFQQMLEQNPLATGALALAVGAAIGLAVPETPQEDRLMGEARDTVVERVGQTAQQTVEKVSNVAQSAAGAAQDAAQQQASKEGLTS